MRLKVIYLHLFVKPNYTLKFDEKSFFHTVLGFAADKKGEYKTGNYISHNIINITSISTINIECDCIQGSYLNGEHTNILYSFPSNTVPTGYKFIERMNPPIYLPLTRKYLDRINFKISDDKGNLIDFNNEYITMYLHLKQV